MMRGWWDMESLNTAHVLVAINHTFSLRSLVPNARWHYMCVGICVTHDSIFSCPALMSRFCKRAGRFTGMDPYVCQFSYSCWRGSAFQKQGSHEGTYHSVSLSNKNLVKQLQELFRGSIIVPNSYRPVAVSEGQISISYFHTPPPHPFHFPSLSL